MRDGKEVVKRKEETHTKAKAISPQTALGSFIIGAAASPDKSAYELFTGRRPNVLHIRVFGCAVYCKIFNPITKMADQAVRCVCLGRAPSVIALRK